MKKILFATISAGIIAASAAPLAAYAADGPAYPDIYDSPLTFEALCDYAVGGEGVFAFADGNGVQLLQGEDLSVYPLGGKVGALDFIQGENGGNFYFTLEGSADVYVLPAAPGETPQKAAGAVIKETVGEKEAFSFNGLTYSLREGTLNIWDGTSNPPASYEGYARLKVYGESLYAISGNELFKIDGTTPQKLEFGYSNYGMLTKIPTGDAAKKLNTYATFGQNIKIVNVAAGAVATKLDLNKLTATDGIFPVESPRENTVKLLEGQALLLCEVGTLRIIAQGADCYILNAADAPDFTELPLTAVAEGTTATVNADEYAHALPYLNNATRAFKVAPSQVVDVLFSVSADSVPVLAHNFYLVKNADGAYGYISAEFLNDLNYPVIDEGGASAVPDPNPDHSDNVRTVVLVLVVVALTLIAAGYITWVATNRRKKVKKNADGEVDVTREQRAEDGDNEE